LRSKPSNRPLGKDREGAARLVCAPDFDRSLLIASAVNPADGVPAAISEPIAMHAGHTTASSAAIRSQR